MSLLRSLGSRLWSLIRPTHKHSKEAPGVGTPEAAGQWAQAATAAPQPPVRGVTPPSLATAPARVLPPKSTGSSASTSPFLGQPDPREEGAVPEGSFSSLPGETLGRGPGRVPPPPAPAPGTPWRPARSPSRAGPPAAAVTCAAASATSGAPQSRAAPAGTASSCPKAFYSGG